MTSDPTEDFADRGTHLDLRDVLGEERAPDLTDAILRRHREGVVASVREPEHAETSGPMRRVLLAACVLLGVGAVVAVATMSRGDGNSQTGAIAPRAPTADPTLSNPLEMNQDPSSGKQDPGAVLKPVQQEVTGRTADVRLVNGIRVLVRRVPGSGQVGMETMYQVGFLHEPEGLTQATHLLEHIVCYGGTASYGVGESFALLEQHGTVNAETLPDFTHYDFLLPADKLGLALSIEAERLTSLQITKELIEREAPRCDREADFVAANPQTGMLKHAFMALAQGWRHGADRASIRGGMQDYAVKALRRFHAAVYRPSNLTVVIVGDVDVQKAVAMAGKHLGGIDNPAGSSGSPRFSELPARHLMRWDGNVRAVCLAWPPPESPAARLTLTLLGQQLMQSLKADEEVSAATDSLFASNWNWGVGTLPFFVYATPKDGTSQEELEELLQSKVQEFVNNARVQPGANQALARSMLGRIDQLTPRYIEIMAKRMQRPGTSEADRAQMILGQSAINWEVALRRVEGNAVDDYDGLTEEQATEILKTLTVERCKVTYLIPE